VKNPVGCKDMTLCDSMKGYGGYNQWIGSNPPTLQKIDHWTHLIIIICLSALALGNPNTGIGLKRSESM